MGVLEHAGHKLHVQLEIISSRSTLNIMIRSAPQSGARRMSEIRFYGLNGRKMLSENARDTNMPFDITVNGKPQNWCCCRSEKCCDLYIPFVSPLLLHSQLLLNYGRTALAFRAAAKITLRVFPRFLPLCRPGFTKKMSLLFRRLLFVIFMLG